MSNEVLRKGGKIQNLQLILVVIDMVSIFFLTISKDIRKTLGKEFVVIVMILLVVSAIFEATAYIASKNTCLAIYDDHIEGVSTNGLTMQPFHLKHDQYTYIKNGNVIYISSPMGKNNLVFDSSDLYVIDSVLEEQREKYFKSQKA